MRPLLWLTASPRTFRAVDIREFAPLVAWSTTLLICRNSEEALRSMAQGELKEYMYLNSVPAGTEVLLGTTAFPFSSIERKFYKSFEAYVQFKLFAGSDWVIIHDIPVFDDDSEKMQIKKIKINMKIVKFYLKIREESSIDVKLIGIPQATTIKSIAKIAQIYEMLGVDAIGISLAPMINTRGITYRDNELKNTILMIIKQVKESTTIPIIVLGSQEPNLAKELFIRFGIKTFEGSLLTRKSFPEMKKPPLRLVIENNKAKFVPIYVGKEFSPTDNLKNNIKTWIEFVRKAL